jgi:hypothetical protein
VTFVTGLNSDFPKWQRQKRMKITRTPQLRMLQEFFAEFAHPPTGIGNTLYALWRILLGQKSTKSRGGTWLLIADLHGSSFDVNAVEHSG